MITKRAVYQAQERVDSAVAQLSTLIARTDEPGEIAIINRVRDIIERDLNRAQSELEYLFDVAA